MFEFENNENVREIFLEAATVKELDEKMLNECRIQDKDGFEMDVPRMVRRCFMRFRKIKK